MMRTVLALMALLTMQAASHEATENLLVKVALEKDLKDRPSNDKIPCVKTTTKKELDQYGRGKDSGDSPEPSIPKFTISIAKLLKSGRYAFKHAGHVEFPDRSFYLVSFVPASKGQPGPEADLATKKTSHEERALNWIINQIQGLIYIDDATGGIQKIQADLPKETSFLKVGYVYSFHLEYEQQLIGKVWAPNRILVRLRYNLNKHSIWLMGDDTEHFDEYTTRFSCKTPPPEP